MRRRPLPVIITVAALALPGCGEPPREGKPGSVPDLVIRNARVLDVADGEVLPERTVVVRGGEIARVLPPGPAPAGRREIDAAGRLLTPGLIDAHSHLSYILGDSLSAGGGMITRLSTHPDSVARYRRRYARAYLPHGVTSVLDVGSSEADVEMLAAWKADRVPWAPDTYPAGGALVSAESGRTPFPGHRVVAGPDEAVRAVREYHEMGLSHVKFYWRLRRPEFAAAVAEARRLGLTPTGHVDFRLLPFETALDLGLDSYEHAYTVIVGAMTDEEFRSAWQERLPATVGDRRRARFYLGALEYLHEVGPDDPDVEALIRRLGEEGAVVTPTLHIFAQRLGLAAFESRRLGAFDDMRGLTPDQLEHYRAAYRILADYVRSMHEAGVRLAVGTDWIDPGRAVLSEMLLLHRAGLSMPEVFRAATLDGARALGVDEAVGAVEPGHRANLLLFERDPLSDPGALLGPKTVIKDGIPLPEGGER